MTSCVTFATVFLEWFNFYSVSLLNVHEAETLLDQFAIECGDLRAPLHVG